MIGSDFERFLEKDGAPVSAEFLGLPDKFQEHVPLHDENGLAGYIHRDNVMIELCIAPQETGLALSGAVSRVLTAATSWLGEVAPGITIGPAASAVFPAKVLATKAARELGCDIDFLSQNGDSTPRPPMGATNLGKQRFAGGHLHFSWARREIPAWVGAAVCDMFIGLHEWPFLNARRAAFYGAGSLHRPTKYPDGTAGVEYRPLDCYWTITPEDRDRVAKRADVVHQILTFGSMDFLGRIIDRWQPLQAATTTLVGLGKVRDAEAAGAWAYEEFGKEFAHDPV